MRVFCRLCGTRRMSQFSSPHVQVSEHAFATEDQSIGSQRRMNAQAEGIEQNVPKARESKNHITGKIGSEVNLPLSSPSA